ncbi:MAG: Uma2 family endonuclease [Oscillospiraceae bacterium]|jgi:Uma2 family endonuclease|nr:Uma2 family endonuclease [Oscillospiraceae bacterium]
MEGNLAEDRTKLYTYADYLTWDDGQRWELIHGRAYLMAAPGTERQRTSGALFFAMYGYFQGKPCQVFSAPFDVRLFPGEADDDYNVLQPDISVIYDPERVDERGGRGAPTLTVEILSPSTASRDFTSKMDLYREAGVKEYWIADPFSRVVHVYLLQAHEKRRTWEWDETLASPTFPGLEIPLRDIFPGAQTKNTEE